VAAGVRRIEAVTGEGAFDYVLETEHRLRDVAGLVRGSRDDVEEKVRQLMERGRKLEKEIAGLKDRLASGRGQDLAAGAEEIGGLKVVATSVEGADAAALRNAVDQLKSQLGSAVIVLGSAGADGKVTLIAGVTADATARVKAGEVINFVAQQVGGRGGGRADMAQAGGTDVAALPAALKSVTAWVRERLGA
jgi:alanyl-tRNA synthetase